MYRKLFLAVTFALASMMMFAEEKVTPQDTLGIHPYKFEEPYQENMAHWSIYFPVGLSFADMDETGGAKLGSGINNLTMNLGFGVEYDFTPLWSLGGEFNVSNYGKGAFAARKRGDDDYRTTADGKPASFGNLYNMSLYVGFDFADAFFPRRTKTLVNAYGLFGGGIGCYTFQATDATSFSSTRNTNGYNFDPYLLIGLNLEFNVTREFALGARVLYNYYMSDNLDYSSTSGSAADNGRINSNNDGLFTMDLILRYKIRGNKESHVRNMPRGVYDEMNAKKLIAKYAPDCDCAHKVDTIYISSRDTIVATEKEKKQFALTGGQEDIYYVYFDNDKIDLKDEALAVIQQVAAILESDSTLGIQVGGFADNTGSAQRNAWLCDNRAKVVLNEFMEEYGFGSDRAEIRGVGVITGRRGPGSYGPNRRVAIRLVKKDKLNENFLQIPKQNIGTTNNVVLSTESIKTVKTTSNGEKVETIEVKTETLAPEKVAIPTPDTYTAKGGESLSDLANRQYGNKDCWVYIYSANITRLGGKKTLEKGDMLVLPILTDEQKKISSTEADAFYRSLK